MTAATGGIRSSERPSRAERVARGQGREEADPAGDASPWPPIRAKGASKP
jgi:hypothetical protein